MYSAVGEAIDELTVLVRAGLGDVHALSVV